MTSCASTYEFQAIDRPLTRGEMEELRAVSTRTRITATSFVNHYDWGSLKASPRTLVERYFDAHVYVAGAQARDLLLRFVRTLLDLAQVKRYGAGYSLTVQSKGKFVLLGFFAEVDADTGDWETGEGWLASLIPLRSDIANGDCRSLYLAWLHGVQTEEVMPGTVEPPVPQGLRDLSGPLESLTGFLEIDSDLIAAAADVSPADATPTRQALLERIGELSNKSKDTFLLQLATGEEANLRARLLQRLRLSSHDASVQGRRTAQELLDAAARLAGERRRFEAQRVAREKARRERKQARERARYLAQLGRRQAAAWRQVEALISKRTRQGYKNAIALLADLREFASTKNRTADFETRVSRLRERHARKTTLIDRLDRLA